MIKPAQDSLDKLHNEVEERSARTSIAALKFLEAFFQGTASIEITTREPDKTIIRLIQQ